MRNLLLPACALMMLVACRSQPGNTLFTAVDAAGAGINFSNTITENETMSVLNYEYIFNGGGVGIGDFNNDSLPDIYFTGNMVSNQLYLNEGSLKFRNITEAAGVGTQGRWSKGVSIADVNQDGWQDIYVCAAVAGDSSARRNMLFINNGVAAGNTVPTFTEQAAAYGLADEGNSHMAVFFDYDRDGDLDVYLLQNDLDGTYPNEFRPIRKDGSWPNTDKLLRNDYDSTWRHAVYTDVSQAAGITIEGHGLGVNVSDINADGWPDIYVSNDYLSNNIWYINNGDGTFTDRAAQYLKHTSKNAMGNDIADINNDGLPDLVETDMAPADNYRLKMMFSDIGYQTWQNSDRFGYMHQYPRNMLQVNQGMWQQGDSSKPLFAEMAYLAGVAQTDWSWAPLLADMDNDGWRDLLVSNGLPRDMSDLDFMAYRRNAVARTPLPEVLKQLPEVKVSNYAFRNNGDLTFSNATEAWGWNIPTFSAGMATADFDRDGDLDVILNNTNMPVTLLRNEARQQKEPANFLRVVLQGNAPNRQGLGAKVQLHYGSQVQVYEHTPYRGYMSTTEAVAHFGLGKQAAVDSVVIIWNNGAKQVLRNPAVNGTLVASQAQAGANNMVATAAAPTEHWVQPLPAAAGLQVPYNEVDFIDFNIQRLITHKFTQYGPALAVGDVNGDGRDDVVMGGGSPYYGTVLLQQPDGRMQSKPLNRSQELKYQDDAGLCLFDADGDGDLDLYIASGGGENPPQSAAYLDHVYINDGRGNFTDTPFPFLDNRGTKSAVKAADYDGDGDLDLFVGGRFIPGRYPEPASSILYRNDSKPNSVVFTDVTRQVAPELMQCGLVSDAVWTDVNNDGKMDLMLAMEWGGITTLANSAGKLTRQATGIEKEVGWWNSLHAADLDDDGDMDYVAGNFGRNSIMQASGQQPVSIYGKDFDSNGSYDAVVACYLTDSMGGVPKAFPVAGRDEFLKEMTAMKERFPNYRSYARSDMSQLFASAQMQDARVIHATQLQSCWIENKGNFQLVLHALPLAAQVAPVYATMVTDANGDGKQDIVINGNEYAMGPSLGRIDALQGLVLQGNGKGEFVPQYAPATGYFVPGNGRSLVMLWRGNQPTWLAGVNGGYTQAFAAPPVQHSLLLQPADAWATVYLSNGGQRKVECSYGSSFLSQSSRRLPWSNDVLYMEIMDSKGNKRKAEPPVKP